MNLQDLLLERIESAMIGVRNPRTKAVLKFDLIADIGERTNLTIIPYKMTELKFEPTVSPFVIVLRKSFNIVDAIHRCRYYVFVTPA